MSNRNEIIYNKIIKGENRSDIAKEFGISISRVGQIYISYKRLLRIKETAGEFINAPISTKAKLALGRSNHVYNIINLQYQEPKQSNQYTIDDLYYLFTHPDTKFYLIRNFGPVTYKSIYDLLSTKGYDMSKVKPFKNTQGIH